MSIQKSLLLVTCGLLFCSQPGNAQNVSYAKSVNTLIGTEGKGATPEEKYLEAGYTFPGAMYPFGMAQFTPTFFEPDKGFVINQMSGGGCEHMGNLPLLPLAGPLKQSPDHMLDYKPGFKVKHAYAGFYEAVTKDGINSGLTVTKRTGMGQFTFPAEMGLATIVIGTGLNGTKITDAAVKITSEGSFEGYADGGTFCGSPVSYRIYFTASFNIGAATSGTWSGKTIHEGGKEVKGDATGVYFTFKATGKPVLYKVGISYVSLANARENLRVENPGWDFPAIREKAVLAWNRKLGNIEVSGGTSDQVIQFYTHLYHSFAHPNLYSDVNGDYVGGDNRVHKIKKGTNYYTSFSNWDTYRTQTQLISMLAPEETSQMMQSVILFAEQSGGSFPRWVLGSTETGIMQGDPTSAMVATAYAFGAKGFDVGQAMRIMRKGSEVPGAKSQNELTRPHLEDYLEKGYMNASMLLEYTTADFAIGQFALQAFRDQGTYNKYLKSAQKWKNLYNPERKWLQSRNSDGNWKKYDEDWREATYKTYFWMVPYNLKTLIDTIGGKDFAESRLDDFFRRLDATYAEEWFAAGNQPDFQAPWIYNWTNSPYKTQSLVKRIIKEQYANRNNGLPGNDDLGTMGSWYVFANIGLYPVIPAVGGFAINGPAFEHIKIHFPGNKVFYINGGSLDKDYIQSLKVNGKMVNNSWIKLSELSKGGVMDFTVSADPNKTWGTQTSPPSFDK